MKLIKLNKAGFTLVELVVVILVISVLAISVVPRVTNTSDFASIGARDNAINLLRTVQQRAMQNTQTSNTCHFVRFIQNDDAATFEMGLSNQDDNGACASGFLVTETETATRGYLKIEKLDYLATNHADEELADSIDFELLGFDSLGRPIPSGTCDGEGCVITINSHQICIESQGYIHVCP